MPFSFSLEAETFHPNQYFITIIFIVSFLLLTSYITCSHFAFAQNDNAYAKIQVANNAVITAFKAVSDAENVGANVTDLYDQLNIAATSLAQAKNLYQVGATESAAAKADSILPIVQKVVADAQDMEKVTIVNAQNTFLSLILFSIFGSVFFLLCLFLVWLWVKRSYIRF